MVVPLPFPQADIDHDRAEVAGVLAAGGEVGGDVEAQLVAAGREVFGRQEGGVEAAVVVGGAAADQGVVSLSARISVQSL